MLLSVVIVSIMRTVDKGVKISAIILAKAIFLLTNAGPPTLLQSSFVSATVDVETMKLETTDEDQLQNPVGDGRNHHQTEAETTTQSFLPAAANLSSGRVHLFFININ